MKLSYLLIAGYDSMNQPLAALAAELVARGSSVTVVANNCADSANLAPFARCGIAPVEVSRFRHKQLDAVDVVVMAPVRGYGLAGLLAEVRRRQLLIVSFANLFSSVVMREYPDLVLALGQAKADELAQAGLAYNLVAVGNPQYDALVRARRPRGGSIQRVLVIDQGSYPYGELGKRQLAATLVALARFNPQLRFDLKPRFYAQLAGRQTHQQTASVVDFLQQRPANLQVLQQPAQLEELIVGYDAVVTTWSTAYLDAALLDVPLIIVGGLSSEDVFDVRTQRVQAAYGHLAATGCVHSWQELQAGPVPFAYVDEAYLQREVYGYRTPCCGRVIHAIELAWEACGRPQRRWMQPFALTYEQFVQQVATLPTEPLAGAHGAARQAYRVQLNACVQQWAYTNRCLACPVDLRPFASCFALELDDADPEGPEQQASRALQQAEEQWQAALDGWFSRPGTRQQARTDAVLQDFSFEWLYEKGQAAAIEGYEGTVLATASRAYHLARVELDRGNAKRACAHLQVYLLEVCEGDAAQLRQRRRALQHLLPLARQMGPVCFARFALRAGNVGRLLALAKQAFGISSTPALVAYALRMRGRLLR